jgi:hypothetical protein
MLCEGTHKTEEHQCDVVRCKAKSGQNCNHNANKCANCNGGHIVESNECPKKRAALAKALQERTSWRDGSRIRTNEVTSQRQDSKEGEDEVREDRAASTSEAENKVGDKLSVGKRQEKEVEMPAMQSAPEESISETQW